MPQHLRYSSMLSALIPFETSVGVDDINIICDWSDCTVVWSNYCSSLTYEAHSIRVVVCQSS